MELYINTDALPEGYSINFHSREEWRLIHRENEGFLLVTPAGVKTFDVPQHHRHEVYDLMYEERQLALCALALALLKKSPKTKKVDVLTWVAPSCGLVWNIFTGLPGVRPGATVGEVRKALKAKLTKYTEQVPVEPVSVPKSVTIKIRKKDLNKVRFADSGEPMTLYCSVIGSPESNKSFSIRTKGGSVGYLAREELNHSIFGLPYEQRFLAVAALLKRKLDALPEGTLVDAVEIFNFAPNCDEDTHLDGSSLFLPTPGLHAGKSISVDTWCAVIDSVLAMYTKPDAKEVVVELNDSDLGRVEFRDFDRGPFDTFDVHSIPDIGFTVTFLDGTKKRFTPKGNHRSNIYNARFEDRPYAVAALAAEKAKSKTRNGLVTVALNEVTMGEARHAILDTTNDLLLPLTIEGINDLLTEKFHIKTVE